MSEGREPGARARPLKVTQIIIIMIIIIIHTISIALFIVLKDALQHIIKKS